MMERTLGLAKYAFASIFIAAGIMHFVRTDFFLKIMPPYVPWHLEIVYVTGVMEIILGICLMVPRLQRLAAWSLVAFLIAVFPANIHVFMNQQIIQAPPAAHICRLLLQGVLVAWAWSYTRAPREK
jgi:uncharacterized membrane protein